MTSGSAARRARARATHARKIQQANCNLIGLLAAGPPPGLVSCEVDYWKNILSVNTEEAFPMEAAGTQALLPSAAAANPYAQDIDSADVQ